MTLKQRLAQRDRVYGTPSERFWPRVGPAGCWLWTGQIRPDGYGHFHPSGTRTVLAHRMAWELAFGPIPDDLWVLHHCDTPACVRPDHLFLGTHAENMADMVSKGRMRTSARNRAKLTAENVADIRARVQAGESQRSIAQSYGVVQSNISHIIRGATWQD